MRFKLWVSWIHATTTSWNWISCWNPCHWVAWFSTWNPISRSCGGMNRIFSFKRQSIFFYTKFPVTKNKCWENFKIIQKLLFLFLILITSWNLKISRCDIQLGIWTSIWHADCWNKDATMLATKLWPITFILIWTEEQVENNLTHESTELAIIIR